MAQIGLPQALGLGPGIALIPANFQSGFSSSLKPRSDSIIDLSSTPVEEGSVLSGPPKGDICHRYGIEFMLLQRFYQNPDLWTQLKTKYEERQKKRIMKKLKKKEALLKEKGEGKKQQQLQHQHSVKSDADATPSTSQTASKVTLASTRLASLSKDSSDENEEEEEKASQPARAIHRQSIGGVDGASAPIGSAGAGGPISSHGFIILNSRTGVTQTVIQGPLTSKIQAKRDGRLSVSGGNSPAKNSTFYADHPHVKSREELDLFHCLRDLDTTWSWILWSSKDHWNPEFLSFLLEEIEADRCCRPRGLNENIISSYLNRHQFTELYLDGINGGFSRTGSGNRQSAQYDNGLALGGGGGHHYHHHHHHNNAAGNNNNYNNNNNYHHHQPRSFPQSYLGGNFNGGIPPEIFRCSNVRILSLRSNHLDVLPADIGRMQKLEYLALTNNRLQNSSIPYTLSFCSKLKTLLLDDNLLDALPGFLLKMHSLETVHRHGNHNYFKATFMWYHTDVNERILPTFDEVGGLSAAAAGGQNAPPAQPSPVSLPNSPLALNFLSATALLGHKINFFLAEDLAPPLKDFIVHIYERFDLEVCENCAAARVMPSLGYKVITFKNPYLGNTCVPFQHWACSVACAKAIEEPARLEQVSAAKKLDRIYDLEVKQAQNEFLHRHLRNHPARRFWNHTRGGGRRRGDRGETAEGEESSVGLQHNVNAASLAHHYTNFTTDRHNAACCSLM